MLCVPLTTRVRGNRFEVPIAGSRDGVALADQVRSLDWRARKATPKSRATGAELDAVRDRVHALIG